MTDFACYTYPKSELRVFGWPQTDAVTHPRERRVEKLNYSDEGDNVDDDVGHQWYGRCSTC